MYDLLVPNHLVMPRSNPGPLEYLTLDSCEKYPPIV